MQFLKNKNRDKLIDEKLIVVELFIDTKKQLYIQENKLFKLIKVLSNCKWQPIPLFSHTEDSSTE